MCTFVLVVGQTICSFFDCRFWFEQEKSIDSLLHCCCTWVCFVGPVFDVWYCSFDVSLTWIFFSFWVSDAWCVVVVAVIADCCALPIICIGTFAVILLWDWMFLDFNNGGFLIDAENANPRRKIALFVYEEENRKISMRMENMRNIYFFDWKKYQTFKVLQDLNENDWYYGSIKW